MTIQDPKHYSPAWYISRWALYNVIKLHSDEILLRCVSMSSSDLFLSTCFVTQQQQQRRHGVAKTSQQDLHWWGDSKSQVSSQPAGFCPSSSVATASSSVLPHMQALKDPQWQHFSNCNYVCKLHWREKTQGGRMRLQTNAEGMQLPTCRLICVPLF